MAQIIRYRTGIDRDSGQLLRGWPHVAQSLAEIWTTRTNLRVMLLGFGSEIRSFLSEDITPSTVLTLYDELVTTAHREEPEYRISGLQLVHLRQTGALGLKHTGIYYPEGRLQNYSIREDRSALAPIALREQFARIAA